MEKQYAQYLDRCSFSDRKYTIHVLLYDHGMARARIRYKRMKGETSKHHFWLLQRGSDQLCFDECRRECVFDIQECFYYLQMSKTARKWFRKTLRSCFERYLLPDGRLSADLASKHEQELFAFRRVAYNDIDTKWFGRDDVFQDARLGVRRVFVHTAAENLSRLDWKPPLNYTPWELPSVDIHVDKEQLLAIIRQTQPEFFDKLEGLGCDNIEKISFICLPDHKQPGHFACIVEVHFPLPLLYVMPDMDEEQEKYHDWEFKKMRRR